jgi:hypothetical protein
MVSSGKCLVSLDFSYDTREYIVTFPSNYIAFIDNKHGVTLDLSTTSFHFFYIINSGCQNKDDCARDLARNTAIEMLQKQYDVSKITNELIPLISSLPLTSENSNLTCYDSKENVRQCGTLAKRRSCVISHEIKQNVINCSCADALWAGDVFVSIYQ